MAQYKLYLICVVQLQICTLDFLKQFHNLAHIIQIQNSKYISIRISNIRMNIFEVLATDTFSANSFLINLTHSQKSWSAFKRISQSFIENPSETTLSSSRQYWAELMKTSPQISSMATQYYITQLTQHIQAKIKPQLLFSASLQHKMELLAAVICPNRKFIQIFNNDLLNAKIIEIAKQLVNQFQLKSTFTQSFTMAYRRHCHDIIKKELIDFDDEVKEYVQNNSQDLDLNVNTDKIRQVLKRFDDVGLLLWCMQPALQFLNQDLQNFIKFYVDPSVSKQFHKQCLNYGRTFQKSYIKAISSDKVQSQLNHKVHDVDSNVYFLCTKHCSDHMLDIILDFPESLRTIFSLKECVDKSNLLSELSDKLVKGVDKRLLIPGVLTQNILNQYINILKVLQIIDPHGFIFDRVTLPIKNYLLKRNDTLRCIISFLTEDVENYSKLTKEVVKIPSKQYIEEMDSEEDENAAEKWQILAIKENKTKVRIKYKENDLVTMLVNLYGSQEAFINQYQNMLAEKLMSAKDYNIDEEIRNIELLKLRFGEMALQTCNIIVKDVKDSKKNDKQIHGIKPRVTNAPISLQQVNCLAVSKGYWPINYETSNSYIPPGFKEVFDEYAQIYSKKKVMRKIHFHYNLGHVNLTLTFNNGSFDFKCMPIHAILINCFDDTKIKDKSQGVSSDDLSNHLNLPQNIVKQKMSFWIHKGVVKETRMPKQGLSLRRMNSFEDGQVVYYKPVEEYQHIASDEMDDDIDNMIVKESTSMESHLKHIIEGLIISILNINGPKPPEKIHLLLKTIYKTDLDYAYGESQTLEILKKMVQKKKIDFNGETYSSKPQA